MKNNRLTILCVALVTAALAIHFFGDRPDDKSDPVDYVKVVELVKSSDEVKSLEVVRSGDVTLKYKDKEREPIKVVYPDERSLNQLVQAAQERKGNGLEPIPVYTKNPPTESLVETLLISIAPLLLFLLLFFVLMSRMAGMGKLMKGTRFRRDGEEMVKVTFDDVAGLGEARHEVEEVVDFLKHPDKYQKLGARVPRGVLFVGPPGTGKTLMAKATAGESEAAFFSMSGSDFVEMLAGLGASKVRDLFKQARAAAPAIIFIDEIDAVGRARSNSSMGGHHEQEQTLNQLLSEMDGFGDREAIVVIAATNRPDILDSALLRPGRFDRQIQVDGPDRTGRLEILKVHAKGKPISEEDLARVAQRTPGFTGAELANLLNEAALLAARGGLDRIDAKCLDGALERVVAGLERRNRVISETEREVTAYHEVGHALCAHYTQHRLPVQKISIVSRGRALGFTLSIPEQERLLETRESLIDQLTMLMGGRAAELVKFGRASSGASNDMERATAIAFQMVTRFGMSEKIGPRVIAGSEDGYNAAGIGGLRCSPEMAQIVDEEISEIIGQACERAEAILREHQDTLEKVSLELKDREVIEEDEFLAMVDTDKSAAA